MSQQPELRTQDVLYGEDYWSSMDGGAGYGDSPMWEDLAVIVREVFGYDRSQEPWQDATSGMNLLDMGCAFGYLVKHLRRRNIEAWGADISEYAITGAEVLNPDAHPYLRVYDLVSDAPATIAGWPFQVVTCFETMEHIPEEHVADALSHLRKCLAPGGKILFTICLDSRPGWDTDPTHVTIKDRRWWIERLAEAGLARVPHLEVRLISNYYLFHDHGGVFVVEAPYAR